MPLLLGCLVHLRGGGALLLVVLHHGVGDFGSLQVAAAHWAAAYNAALGIREQRIAADLDSSKRQAAKDSGPCSIRPSHPTAVEIAAAMQGPAGLSPPVQATHVLESYAAKGDDLVPQSQLARDTLLLMHDSQAMKIIVQRMMHHTVWRGGGTEVGAVVGWGHQVTTTDHSHLFTGVGLKYACESTVFMTR